MKTGLKIKNLSVSLALLMGLVLSAAPLQAADIEVTPILGFRAGGQFREIAKDERYEFSEDVAGGVILSFNLDGESFIDVSYTHWQALMEPEDATSTLQTFETSVDEIQVGGHYMWDKGLFKPIITGTIGATRIAPTSPETDEEWGFSFSLGTGFKNYFNEHVGLRFNARILGTVLSSSPKFCTSETECIDPKGTVIAQGELTLGILFAF